eukprot:gene11252-biopygen4707
MKFAMKFPHEVPIPGRHRFPEDSDFWGPKNLRNHTFEVVFPWVLLPQRLKSNTSTETSWQFPGNPCKMTQVISMIDCQQNPLCLSPRTGPERDPSQEGAANAPPALPPETAAAHPESVSIDSKLRRGAPSTRSCGAAPHRLEAAARRPIDSKLRHGAP